VFLNANIKIQFLKIKNYYFNIFSDKKYTTTHSSTLKSYCNLDFKFSWFLPFKYLLQHSAGDIIIIIIIEY
jgi:hypothetical protein